MMLMLDSVAQRYGILPSKLLKEGSSLDIVIADAAQGYLNQKQLEAEAIRNGQPYIKPAPKLSEEEMMAMINKVNR